MNLLYREACLADFKKIFLLLKQLWPNDELEYDKLLCVYKIGIESNRQHFIIAEINKNIVGFCTLTIKNNLWQQEI